MSDNIHTIPGQAVLPELADEMGYGAITHLKPQQERFAWAYVLGNITAAAAYKQAYPGTSDATCQANGYRLLHTPKIQTRIAEIRSELQRRYAVDAQNVIGLLAMSMGLDRRQFVDDAGRPLDIQELPPEAAAIADLQIVVDKHGTKRAVIAVPERMKAATELARIMGLSRETSQTTVNVQQNNGVVPQFYIPENGRDVDAERFAKSRERLQEFRGQNDTESQ